MRRANSVGFKVFLQELNSREIKETRAKQEEEEKELILETDDPVPVTDDMRSPLTGN